MGDDEVGSVLWAFGSTSRPAHCNLALGPMSLRELKGLPGGIELLTVKRVSS